MAFLEHIFRYTRRLIEDFTLPYFLMMNEKIIKHINIEIKGSIKCPDSNDGYNIQLGSIKESLDSRLVLFPTEFEIGNIMEKIIRDCFNSIYFDSENSNNSEETDLIHNNTESVVEKLLLLHQKRLKIHYSFFDLINHWTRLKPLDFIKVMKEIAQYRDGSPNLEAALRIKRINAAEKSTS
ncbi:10139_t:CDS:2 [Funneliformis geosporum]|uniref:10139_t:CDS:1 n=1 Tax=Funneliformis geosporum TaxID=1117311 RepID=A0A9W4T350_9GLOM|nr:10139_t:CDS:2 [Funneliformis geosporum]